MKKFLLCFLLLVVCTITTYAQQYKTHVVKKGENVFRISKQYDTTEEEIYRVNPGARDGINEGEVLAIPVTTEDEYETHEVQKDDTVFSLASKYKTTQEAIFILNPEAVNGIQLGQILKIRKLEKPDTAIDIDNPGLDKDQVLDSLKVPEPEIVGFRTHKVKRKETLFGISQKYKVTIDDIKRHNKRLYSEQLKKKDKIRIPIYAKQPEVQKPIDTLATNISATTKYTIQPGETKYSIARRHGITIPDLENLNPGLDPDFPYGTEIIVPTSYYIPFEEKEVEGGLDLYTVPKGETVFNILRNTKISADSLFKMNPYLKDGLKEGMVIKVPKTILDTVAVIDTSAVAIPSVDKYVDLSDKLFNFKPKKLALMLPFGLDTLNMDTRNQTEEFLKKRQSVRIALDLYRGVLVAVDSAKSRGITTELSVFDTQKNKNNRYIKELINQNNFDEIDAVIGPLYQSNAEFVTAELKKYDTPVFSPVSRKEFKAYDNFFQTRPSDHMLQDKMISFIKKDSTDKNLVIIVQNGKKHEEVKSKLTALFPDAKVAEIQEGNFLYEVHLNKVLDEKKPNWIILESNDIALISNVTTLLNAKAESHQITLFTTDKNGAFENDSVKNEYLSKLHLHYPSIKKEFDNNGKMASFTKPYKKKYGVEPNKFAVRGFDIAYDILMRLGSADDVYHAVSFKGTTEYVENKFSYTQQPLGGYYNQAVYLIKFEDDLKLIVLE